MYRYKYTEDYNMLTKMSIENQNIYKWGIERKNTKKQAQYL